MAGDSQWDAATFEGNRLRQQELFRRLTFREKVIALEEMGQVIENLLNKRAALRSQSMEKHLPPAEPGVDLSPEKK